MTDFDSLRSEIIQLGESTVHAMDAQNRLADLHGRQIDALWADNAELRDELLTGLAALSNRIESLSRGLTVDPAQLAESMLHARTGRPLVLAGAPGDSVDCTSCRGSGTTPTGGKCEECDGFGKVRHV